VIEFKAERVGLVRQLDIVRFGGEGELGSKIERRKDTRGVSETAVDIVEKAGAIAYPVVPHLASLSQPHTSHYILKHHITPTQFKFWRIFH
jgi:hypothetical protein